MKTTPEGWIVIKVSDATLEKALERRKAEDAKHSGDVFPGTLVKRAAGYIGEEGFKHWLKARDADFVHRDAPDFIVYGLTVEVKTFSRRTGRYTIEAGHNIPEEQIDDAGISVFFCSYEEVEQHLTLCGAIGRKEFKRVALHMEVGDVAPDKFLCKHACYRAAQKHFWTPDVWLAEIRDIDIWLRYLEEKYP